jgi:serine/threonine protein kinase
MGDVYKARDARLDRTVAIKVLPAGTSEDPDLMQRVEREARAIAALSHSHICTLHDVGQQNGTARGSPIRRMRRASNACAKRV